jgi:undecaprenyl-diphosphatase
VLRDILLGVVQGLTEFLPISSSGHLVVIGDLLDREPSLTFDLLLHVGTLLAVVIAMRRDLWELVEGVRGRGPDPAGTRRMVLWLAVATVPAAVVGLLFEQEFEDLYERAWFVVVEWFIMAAFLIGVEVIAARRTGPVDEEMPTGRRAVGIGVAQAIAISPGISRSGTTIGTALASGTSRVTATRFSFLMSVPVIAGAALARLDDARAEHFDLTLGVWLGCLASFITGWISIRWLLRYVRTHSLVPFAVYLLIAAPIFAILLSVTD